MKLDHLILGISDLEKGIEDFERLTGVRAQFAGVHPNIGTHNALMSLDDGIYLEIIAPQIPGAHLSGPFRGFEHLEELTPVGWVVSGQLSMIRAQLKQLGKEHTDVLPGSRKAPDGRILKWQTIFMAYEYEVNMNPFFIDWDVDTIHPSMSNPKGCTLVDYTIADNGDKGMIDMLSTVSPKPSIVTTTETVGTLMSIGIDTPKGYVKF